VTAARRPASQSAARDLPSSCTTWHVPGLPGPPKAVDTRGLAGQLEVMRLLVRRPGPSVNDVARELGLQPSNASTAIRLLIARGTLERQADSADGRVARLYPTPAAYAARDRREYSWGEALSEVLDDLAAKPTGVGWPKAARLCSQARHPPGRRARPSRPGNTPRRQPRRPTRPRRSAGCPIFRIRSDRSI
jgi:predicted transcriptional regulator